MQPTDPETPVAVVLALAIDQARAVAHRGRAAREAAALALFDLGIPSLNPDEAMRGVTSAHRWGRHGDRPSPMCPVCDRVRAREAAVTR
jgi:hypothetical protein